MMLFYDNHRIHKFYGCIQANVELMLTKFAPASPRAPSSRAIPVDFGRAVSGGGEMLRALLLALCAAAHTAAAAGANEPIAPNELGLTAIDCATQYCTEKDSLLLWLSLENVCFSDKQPRRRGVRDETRGSG